MARSSHREPKPSHSQVRASRRQLSEKIRDNWSYPDPTINTGSVPLSAILARVSESQFKGPPSKKNDSSQPHDDLYSIAESRVVTWKEPYYASSDPSADEEPDNDALNIANAKLKDQPRSPTSGSGIGTRLKRQSLRLIGVSVDKGYEQDAESEDGTPSDNQQDVLNADKTRAAQEVQRRKHERKLRRRARFEYERSWNEGLRFWESRREAWCCAKTISRKESQDFPVEGDTSDEPSEDEVLDERNPSDESGRLVRSEKVPEGARSRSSSRSSALSLRRHHARHQPSHGSTGSPDLKRPRNQRIQTPVFPVATPLLPSSDPTRASMSPALYSSIYSKVVIQSLTPAVPINLTHLIPAIVNGWKADGEWPPTSAPNPVPSMASVRKTLARSAPRSKYSTERSAGHAPKRSSAARPLSWVLPSSTAQLQSTSRVEPQSDQLKSPHEDVHAAQSTAGPSRGAKRDSQQGSIGSQSTPVEPLSHSFYEHSRRRSRSSRPLSWLVDALSMETSYAQESRERTGSKRSSISSVKRHSNSSSKGSFAHDKPLPAPPLPNPPSNYSLTGLSVNSQIRSTSGSASKPSAAAYESSASTASPRRGRNSHSRQRPLSAIFSHERVLTSSTPKSAAWTRSDNMPPTMRTGLDASTPTRMANGGVNQVEDTMQPRTGLRSVGGRIRKRFSLGEWNLASAA